MDRLFPPGKPAVTLVNVSGSAENVEVKLKNINAGDRFYWYTLEGATDNGEFSRKVMVNGQGPSGVAGGPADYTSLKARSAVTTDGIKVAVPARGMVNLVVGKKK